MCPSILQGVSSGKTYEQSVCLFVRLGTPSKMKDYPCRDISPLKKGVRVPVKQLAMSLVNNNASLVWSYNVPKNMCTHC